MVGVREAKSGRGRTPFSSDVGVVVTLIDVDGDFTALGAMFFIFSASILRAFSNAKTLHGGVKELGKSLGVDAVATNPGSDHVVGVRWVHGGW